MIESYSVHIGKILVMMGLVLHAIVGILVLVNVFTDINYFGRLNFNTMLAHIHFPILLGIIPYLVGLVFWIIGKHGDWELKKLRGSTKAIIPVKTLFLPGSSYSIGRWVDDSSFSSFRVECTIRSKKGREITAKSRRLVIRKGLFQTLPVYPYLDYKAVVYQNPKKPHNFAVEVTLP